MSQCNCALPLLVVQDADELVEGHAVFAGPVSLTAVPRCRYDRSHQGVRRFIVSLHRSRRPGLVALLAVGVQLALVATVSGVLPAAPATASSASAPSYERETAVRTFWGLSTDVNVMGDAADADLPLGMNLSIPLLQSEVDELNRRDAVNAAMTSLAATPGFREGYAGHWVDNPSGGVLHVRLLAGSDIRLCVRRGLECTLQEHLRSINEVLPQGTPLRVHADARYSLDQMLAAQDNLYTPGSREAARLAGYTVVSSGQDIESHSVQVWVKDAEVAVARGQINTGDYMGAYAVLPLGNGVQGTAREAADYRMNGRGKAFGGQLISGECTISTSGIGLAGRDYYLITAGHCGDRGRLHFQGLEPGTNLARGAANSWQEAREARSSTDCDCQVIGPVPLEKTSPNVLVASNDQYAFTVVANESAYNIGRRVCHNGATTYRDTPSRIICGVIRDFNHRGPVDISPTESVVTTSQIRVQPDELGPGGRGGAQGGDSGATVGSGPTYMGVLSAQDDSFFYFSRASRLRGAVRIEPRTVESCSNTPSGQPC